jgi:hypothetical protein
VISAVLNPGSASASILAMPFPLWLI